MLFHVNRIGGTYTFPPVSSSPVTGTRCNASGHRALLGASDGRVADIVPFAGRIMAVRTHRRGESALEDLRGASGRGATRNVTPRVSLITGLASPRLNLIYSLSACQLICCPLLRGFWTRTRPARAFARFAAKHRPGSCGPSNP